MAIYKKESNVYVSIDSYSKDINEYIKEDYQKIKNELFKEIIIKNKRELFLITGNNNKKLYIDILEEETSCCYVFDRRKQTDDTKVNFTGINKKINEESYKALLLTEKLENF